jgi:tetrahydromethanopterin S-methyltransferase subunit D
MPSYSFDGVGVAQVQVLVLEGRGGSTTARTYSQAHADCSVLSIQLVRSAIQAVTPDIPVAFGWVNSVVPTGESGGHLEGFECRTWFAVPAAMPAVGASFIAVHMICTARYLAFQTALDIYMG